MLKSMEAQKKSLIKTIRKRLNYSRDEGRNQLPIQRTTGIDYTVA